MNEKIKDIYKKELEEGGEKGYAEKFLEAIYKVLEKLHIIEKGGAERKIKDRLADKAVKSWVEKAQDAQQKTSPREI